MCYIVLGVEHILLKWLLGFLFWKRNPPPKRPSSFTILLLESFFKIQCWIAVLTENPQLLTLYYTFVELLDHVLSQINKKFWDPKVIHLSATFIEKHSI